MAYFTYRLLHGSLWLYLEGLETGPSWRKRVKWELGLRVIAHPSSRLSLLLPSLQNCDKDFHVLLPPWSRTAHAFPATRDPVPINCDPKVSSSTLELFLSGVLLGDKATRSLL